MTTKSHLMNVELYSGTKPHLDAKLQNKVNAHSNFEVSIHERYVEIPNRDVHSDFEAKIQNEETRLEPRLSKYVKRHHLVDQIIGNKDARPITRNRLRIESCLLSMKEPKTIKDALEDVDWCKAMEEEIEQIEKKKTWSLVPRSKGKNVIGTKWVFLNKIDENGEVTRKKERLV